MIYFINRFLLFAAFALAEVAPEFNDKTILLADARDGKPLDEKQGKWQIIVLADY